MQDTKQLRPLEMVEHLKMGIGSQGQVFSFTLALLFACPAFTFLILFFLSSFWVSYFWVFSFFFVGGTKRTNYKFCPSVMLDATATLILRCVL